MKKLPNNNADNIVFALIAVTGLSVASQSGLGGQLFQVLDQTLVKSASAQNIRLQREQQVTPSDNLRLQKLDVNRILIEDDQAYQIDKNGKRTSLQDGYYRFPSGEILTLEEGRITDQRSTFEESRSDWKEGGTWAQGPDAGPWEEAGWRDGNVWERDTSGDESMQRELLERRSTPAVRDTFDRIRPQIPSRNTTPIDPSSTTQPGRFNRVPPNTTTPNDFRR